MYSFKKSLAALVGLLVIAAAVALLPHAGLGQGDAKNPLKRDARRSFYLTAQATYNGAQALSACAEGYHMASLWEIFDPSNLRYDTQLGFTQADSGFGPPQEFAGWVRTGGPASPGFTGGEETSAGDPNCLAYTSSSEDPFGTQIRLSESWVSTSLTIISPWQANTRSCNSPSRVWCVQD